MRVLLRSIRCKKAIDLTCLLAIFVLQMAATTSCQILLPCNSTGRHILVTLVGILSNFVSARLDNQLVVDPTGH